MYQFDVLTTREAWLPYKEKWQQIVDENGADNPFLEFDLLYTWWEFVAKGDIEIHVCSKDGEVKGFLPLTVKQTSSGIQYQFIGETDLNYMDFIILDAEKYDIIPAFLEELLGTDEAVMLELRGIEETSPTNEILEHTCTKERYPYNFIRTVSPYVSLVETPQETYAPLYKNSLKRHRKRLNKLGKVVFRAATPEDLPAVFALFDKRWSKKSDTSGFTSPEKQAFFTALMQYDITKLEVFELDDKMLGFTYCFQKGDRFVCYLHSFDEDYGRFGSGHLLDYYMMLRRYEEDVDIVDFSIGYEDYKYRWATHSNFVRTYYMANEAGRSLWQRQALIGKCVEITKKSQKAVRFKRNTLGRAKYWMENYRQLPQYTQQNIFSKEVDIYRLARRKLRTIDTAQLLTHDILQYDLTAEEIDLLYRQYDFYKIGNTVIHVNERTCKEADWHYTILLKQNERYIPNIPISYAEEVARNFNEQTIYTKVDADDESKKQVLLNLGFEHVTTMQISRFFKKKKMVCDDFKVIGATKVRLMK